MSINSYKPHVLILPEDAANCQIVIGFLLDPSLNVCNVKLLKPSGGWARVLDSFKNDHINDLRKYPNRHFVMVIDFDAQGDSRRERFESEIPVDLRDRVYLLGSSQTPEALKNACRCSFESIGKQLAEACYSNTEGLWSQEMLADNQTERSRLNGAVKSILF